VAGDTEVGAAFEALIEGIRYPVDGLTEDQIREIRRIKARVETERLPRGADPTLHTKLGRGGLADVEWAAQLLQLRHAGREAELRCTGTLETLEAARRVGLLDPADAAAFVPGVAVGHPGTQRGTCWFRGRPADSPPTVGRELTAVARCLGYAPAQSAG